MRKLIISIFVLMVIAASIVAVACSRDVVDVEAVAVEDESISIIVSTPNIIGTTTPTASKTDDTLEYSNTISATPIKECTYSRDSKEVTMLAKLLWGECRGVASRMNQAAVVWCVLNRVDSSLSYMPDDIVSVVTQKNQFIGYRKSNPVDDDLVDLAMDVLGRWEAEKSSYTDVGRVLPKEYIYFYGDGIENHFRNEYNFSDSIEWNFDCYNPYEVK